MQLVMKHILIDCLTIVVYTTSFLLLLLALLLIIGCAGFKSAHSLDYHWVGSNTIVLPLSAP